MQALDITTKHLFRIVIEEVNAQLLVSWEGEGLEVRKEGRAECLYINRNDELFKILEIHDASVDVITTHRNKIPLYYRHSSNLHYISNSVSCLVHTNDTVALDAISLALTLMNIGDPKSYFINIFKDIPLLQSSSTYTIDHGKLQYKCNYYSQYFNNARYTNKDDLVELLYNKYEYICSNREHVHLFLSAGYDSRLELALMINAIKKHKNKITLHHYSEFGLEHDIVMSIAKDYKLDLVLYNGNSLFHKGVADFTADESTLKSNSGPFQIGLYFALAALKYIQKNTAEDHTTDVFLVNNVGALKGRYYPPMEEALYVDKNRFESIKSRLNINIMYDEFLQKRQHMLDYMVRCVEEIQDMYAKLDVLYAMVFHSNLFGKRIHTLMARNCAFPIDDDVVWLMFSNLCKEEKEGPNFIKYTVKKLENNLNSYKYVSGNRHQFQRNLLSKWYQRLENYRFKLSNSTNNNIAERSELILSIANHDDVRSEVLREIRKHILGPTLTSSLYSLQTLKFLSILEHEYHCSFTLV
jgi:hypothetical protein